MRDRAQDVLAKLLLDTPGICSDAGAVTDVPSLQLAWEEPGVLDLDLWWWFVCMFESPEDARRIRSAADQIRRVFVEDAQRRYVRTGEASPLPEALIRRLEMAVAYGLHPVAYTVGIGATKRPYDGVSAQVIRRTSEASWRTK